jgi:hypothetical protein
VPYWENGNDLYGNNSYGGDWEYDRYTKGQGPVAYGERAMQFMAAMKAVDPSIQVGVVLTAPGNWPDQEANPPGPNPAWNPTVLQQTCGTASTPGLDFADVHGVCPRRGTRARRWGGTPVAAVQREAPDQGGVGAHNETGGIDRFHNDVFSRPGGHNLQRFVDHHALHVASRLHLDACAGLGVTNRSIDSGVVAPSP